MGSFFFSSKRERPHICNFRALKDERQRADILLAVLPAAPLRFYIRRRERMIEHYSEKESPELIDYFCTRLLQSVADGRYYIVEDDRENLSLTGRKGVKTFNFSCYHRKDLRGKDFSLFQISLEGFSEGKELVLSVSGERYRKMIVTCRPFS